ncbi:hypothetical protein BB561_001531 [Smittium simulii]|uniref:Uncharacterized protein n=1 Tax=Smittium simulii TaxID=133385 RepID=A0A2T9YU97_9FUNG|nr:hypothetical protein BB561_001531 [Smittium simulii]
MDASAKFSTFAATFPTILSSTWSGNEKGYFPIAIAATIHAVKVSYMTRKILQLGGRRHLASEFLLQLVYGFGGAIIARLALGLPQPWIESNSALPLQALTFLLLTNLPGDILFSLMDYISPLSDVILATADGLITGYGITSGGVDLVKYTMSNEKVSKSIVAMLFVGTVMGCGGGSLGNLFMLKENSTKKSISLSNLPFFEIKLSAFLTLFYISTTRLWTFTEYAPNFVFSPILDKFIDSIVVPLSANESKMVVATAYGSIMGFKAYSNALVYKTAIAKVKAAKVNKTTSKSKKDQ